MARKIRASEQKDSNGTAVPILADGIGTRIKAAADKIGSRKKAAQAAGVSDDMLYKYIRETSAPSFTAMAGLCAEAGLSLDWMATGKAPMDEGDRDAVPALGRPDHDMDALQDIMEKVLALLDKRRPDLSPKARARIVRLVYEFYVRQEKQMDEASLDNVIELAAFR